MKTEQEIREKLLKGGSGLVVPPGWSHGTYATAFIDALKWVLGPMPPEPAVRFACPKCGACILKVEPCTGYYKYEVDKYTGEVIYNSDFESQNVADSWFECSSCRTIMNAEWRVQREKASGDEEDSDG